MQIVRKDEAPLHEIPGIAHRTVAGHAHGLSSMEVWHQVMAPGCATPVHRHACEEVVFVVSGAGAVIAGEQRFAFSAGATLIVPSDAVHQIVNDGSEPLVMVAALGAAPVRVRTADGAPLPVPWQAPGA